MNNNGNNGFVNNNGNTGFVNNNGNNFNNVNVDPRLNGNTVQNTLNNGVSNVQNTLNTGLNNLNTGVQNTLNSGLQVPGTFFNYHLKRQDTDAEQNEYVDESDEDILQFALADLLGIRN